MEQNLPMISLSPLTGLQHVVFLKLAGIVDKVVVDCVVANLNIRLCYHIFQIHRLRIVRTGIQKTCSYFIPGLFGLLISTALISLGLFAFDWRMALAALWVIPVSVAILLGSYRVQDRVQRKSSASCGSLR